MVLEDSLPSEEALEDPNPPEVVLEDQLLSEVLLEDLVSSEEALEDPNPPEVVLEDQSRSEEMLKESTLRVVEMIEYSFRPRSNNTIHERKQCNTIRMQVEDHQIRW